MASANPAFDPTSLNSIQQRFIKQLEAENLKRVEKLKRIRRRNIFTGVGLILAVTGIYAYTIMAVKQEAFLDDLDVKSSKK